MIDYIVGLGWDAAPLLVPITIVSGIFQTALGVRFFGRKSRWMPKAKDKIALLLWFTGGATAVLLPFELIWAFGFVLPWARSLVGNAYGVAL